MILLRLVIYLALSAVLVALLLSLLLRDRRYVRFAWQIFKFSLVLSLLFLAVVAMGRIVLFRLPL